MLSRALLSLAVLIAISGCKRDKPPPKNRTVRVVSSSPAKEPAKEEPPEEEEPPAAPKLPAAQKPEGPVDIVAVGRIFVDQGGKRQVSNVFGFVREPKVEAQVLVFAGSQVARLKIDKTEKRDDIPGEIWWDVELSTPPESLADKTEVLVLYPAPKFAHLLDVAKLEKGSLPKGVAAASIKWAAAIGLDETPDAIVTEYCCDKPTQPAVDCEYVCGKTFLRGDDAWTLVRTSEPQ